MPCDLFDHKHEHEHEDEHEQEFDPEFEHHHPKPPCDCTLGECRKEIDQYCDISVPIDLDPSATIGRIETVCVGDPIVECRHDHCDNTCRIRVTQRMRVTIPITYTVITCVDDPIVTCCVDGTPCPCDQ